VATQPKGALRRRFWRVILLLLVILPLLPEIVVLSASAIADLSGCRVDDAPPITAIDGADSSSNADLEVPPDPWMVAKGFTPAPGSAFGASNKACAIGPLVSSVIRLALTAGYFVGVTFGSGAVAAWLAVCYVSISRGWTRLLSRLAIAFFVSLIFSFAPYFGPMLSILRLENPYCEPNEGGVGGCAIYGRAIGSIVNSSVVMGWYVFVGAPVALGAFAIYSLFILSVRLATGRRARSPA
jgi:hypothetical protein